MKTFDQIFIYTDGGSRGNPGPGAAAFVVLDIDGEVIFKEGFYLGKTTNNVAEYQAVIKALGWLSKKFKDKADGEIIFFLDSQLVVNQLNGLYKVKNWRLKELIIILRVLEKGISHKICYRFIPREKNWRADKLVNKILDKNKKII